VPARLADYNEIAHASAVVCWSFHKCSGLSSSRGKCRYFLALVALKSKVIERLAHLTTRNDDDELRIITWSGLRAEPDSSSTFLATVVSPG